MIPAQAPYEGEEPTMRKGSYSEELVKIVVDARIHLRVENPVKTCHKPPQTDA